METKLVEVYDSREEKFFDLFFFALWEFRWVNIFIITVFSVGSVFYALSLPNEYRSTVQLTPAENDNNSGLSGMLGQLGGLASVAGLNVGGSSQSVFQLEEMLRSRDFIISFINRHNMKKDLFAAESWDRDANQFLYNSDIYDTENDIWVRDVKPPKTQIPSDEEAYEKFREIFKVLLTKKKNLFVLSMDSYSPYKAKEWLAIYVEDFNHFMKEKDIKEAQRSLNFLNEYAKESTNSELQKASYGLVEEQLKVLMLTKSKENYAFDVIQSAFAPDKKNGPKRAFICIGAFMIGFLLSLIISIILYVKKSV